MSRRPRVIPIFFGVLVFGIGAVIALAELVDETARPELIGVVVIVALASAFLALAFKWGRANAGRHEADGLIPREE